MKSMTRAEIIEYLYDNNVHGDLKIEDMADDLAESEPNAWLIGYGECASAMLKMWIDCVLTDGEYNRIMNKLNKVWNKKEGE